MRVVRALLLVCLATFLGVATTAIVAWRMSVEMPAAIKSGTESLRWPTNDRCGIALHRLDRSGGVDLTVQTGMVIRQGGPFDDGVGRVESRVPEWARDALTPWGWNGAWQPGMRSVRHLVTRGWPVPAFAAVFEAKADTPTGPAGWIVIEGVDLSPPRADPFAMDVPRVLPTRLIWDGIAMNTVVFSSAWFVVLIVGGVGFMTSRRSWRRRRGRCAWCNYAMPNCDTGAMCPECGRA